MSHCEIFLKNRGELLGEHGYESDPGKIKINDNAIIFYHYTHRDNYEKIMKENESGLYARLSVPQSDKAPEFKDCYLVEALLEPLPKWIIGSPYFGDVGLTLLESYVSDLLLKIEVPLDYPGLYVADYAHILESKHILRRGGPALNLGYNIENGRETIQADVHSYIPVLEYKGGHIAPEIKVVRKGKGIAIPNKYITISEKQPFKDTSDNSPYRYLKKIYEIPERIIKQIDSIDKIVYAIVMYKIRKKIFPENIDDITKATEDLKKRLCFPKSQYDISFEMLYSKKFNISKDRSTCFVYFDNKKTSFDEIRKYFVRPNFINDKNCLIYKINI
jgi:hypothetical protein